MARIETEGSALLIVFAYWEAPFVGRRRLRLDHAEIIRAAVVERPMRERFGTRAGFWITGLVKVGLFGTTRRCLTSIHRGAPALHLRLDGTRRFQEVLVSVADADAVARAVERAR